LPVKQADDGVHGFGLVPLIRVELELDFTHLMPS
jgi:hypothetical protein